MDSKRFLFVWWDGGGNMPPALHLVRQLVKRGHFVHVLSDPSSEAAFCARGATFTRLRRAPHRVDHSPLNDPIRDWEARSPKQSLEIVRDRILFGPARGFAEDTRDAIDRYRPHAIAIMDFTFGAMVAAERSGTPAAVVAPHILAYPVPGRPPFGPGLLPARHILDRFRDRFLSTVSSRVLGKALPDFNSLRDRFDLAPVREVFEQAARMQRILVMTSPALELPGGPLPANVRYTGPILDDPSWTEPRSLPPSVSNKPLVIVSFSTTFQNQGGAIRRVIGALGALPVRALVTVGPALQHEDFPAPPNVLICDSVPHSQVLPEASLMVTHAGHGSVVRALSHGVPLVCVPMGRDQNDIAARVVHHGAGVRVSPGAPQSEFGYAIRQVLENPRFQAAAETLGEHIRRDAQNSTAIAELEELAGCRSAEKIRADMLAADTV